MAPQPLNRDPEQLGGWQLFGVSDIGGLYSQVVTVL